LRLAPPPVAALSEPARPLAEIARQPVFLTAVACSTAGYAVMVLVMTATPLAMVACGFPVARSATVIQWHVLGMFVPAFFTGSLVDRFGVVPVIVTGAVLLAAQMIVALSGLSFAHFLTSLILLGVGWNFLFIGGTTLLTRAYRPAERAKAQATHYFVNFRGEPRLVQRRRRADAVGLGRRQLGRGPADRRRRGGGGASRAQPPATRAALARIASARKRANPVCRLSYRATKSGCAR
jgi:hypothetical protein